MGKIDHIEEAKAAAERGAENMDGGKPTTATVDAQLAQAHALIAIAQLLDSIVSPATYNDLSGWEHSRLRVDG